ncbi:hypothetical protein IPA_09440 [Ignicoccus pacificus DSM 13166]|uniref:Uncharacterized protein n=1 Tax=Ignicoccus pacificus DSM 13166 TaxID=940294 RepID=A0A977KC45_9CREN|nr:hypothetical protein IPA_09440 [Ignicoccus pacificus DSM 13166]
MAKDKLGIWRKNPLYFIIYNILSAVESIQLDGAGGLIERLQYVEPFKEVGISKVEVIKALMYLELNGLIHVRRVKNNLIISLNKTPVETSS